MKRLIKDIILYLKHKEEVNELYGYGIKLADEFPTYGSINEEAGWRERLWYWLHSE